MKGHHHVKQALLAYLETWVPIRLALIREMEEATLPIDPEAYLAVDSLPDNPELYPLIAVLSTTVAKDGMQRRQVSTVGEITVYDIDYDVTLIVGVEVGEYEDAASVTASRDRLLLAVRECVLQPAQLDDFTSIHQSPLPDEQTGAAVQTVRGRPLAAGTINLRIRCMETLMPTVALADVLTHAVDVSTQEQDQSFVTP